MKIKTLNLIMTLSLMTQIVSAQIIGGVKASVLFNDAELNGTTLSTDNIIKPMTGYGVGFTAEYPFSEAVSVSGELSYTHLGFQLSERTSFNVIGIDIPVGATVTTAYNKLEMPVLMRYKKPIGDFNLFAEAGPSFNYLLNGYIETKANSILDFNVNKTDLNLSSDTYKRASWAGNIGIGAEYLTSQNFVVSGGIRYTHDMSNSIRLPVVDASIRNRGISLSMGVAQRF